MSVIVGIDLGTTNSLCAVFRDGVPELIPNAHGEVLTPSIVGVLENGQVVVGATARELMVTRPERCAARFKRLMGTEQVIDLPSVSMSAAEASSLVLTSLKRDAESKLGQQVTDAVITVPAYFNEHQRRATKLAGEIAGLNVRRILNEPTAAALTYGFHDRHGDRKVLVIDLGGGTFDVTMMEIFEGTLEIMATGGESFLGGEDFTDRMAAHILQGRGQQLELAEVHTPLLVSRLRRECEMAKRTLLEQPTATVRIPAADGSIGEAAVTRSFTREEFASMCKPLMQRLAGPVGKVLRDTQLSPTDLDDVILVGGATRMLVVGDFVRQQLGKEPLCKFNPDEVVALGAAVQAALIQDDRAVEDMLMTDVCPHTLGVEVSKEFGRERSSGYFLPIINRNTTIPVSREEVVCTIYANQREVLIKVYQGDARRVKDNLLLGELAVGGIPPGPKGMDIHIRFTYDSNGILEVEAYVPSSQKKFQTVLTQHTKGLSEADLKRAIRNMQRLKFYPRDELRNQRLVLYCERLFGEVSTFHRETLSEALDSFEAAMSRGDREDFKRCREGLLVTLSELGFAYDEPEEGPPDEPGP